MKWTAILLGYTRCRSDITRLAAFQTVNNTALSRVGKTCQNKHSRRPQSLSAEMTVFTVVLNSLKFWTKKTAVLKQYDSAKKLNPEQRRISAVVEKYCYYWVQLGSLSDVKLQLQYYYYYYEWYLYSASLQVATQQWNGATNALNVQGGQKQQIWHEAPLGPI